MSYRELFVEKYVEYICSMTHVSKITQFNNYFYQLILFIHEGAEKHNKPSVTHKIKNNCLFVDKIFDDKFSFKEHGVEYNMCVKYITEYCNNEIQMDMMQGHTQQQTFYGCDFECPTTFKLISDKLKFLMCSQTKESLIKQQKELEQSKMNDSPDIFDAKQKIFKQRLITTKNIMIFIDAIPKTTK